MNAMNSPRVAAAQRFHSWPASIALFAVATGGEFIGLCGWYYYHVAAQPVPASIILWIGFLVERSMVVLWLHLPRTVLTPSGNLGPLRPLIAAITVAEIIAWTLWIRLTEIDQLLAAILVLVVGIHVIHAYEVALIKRREFRPTLVDPGVVFLTVLECIGGVVGLHLATDGHPVRGAAVMLGALLIEHIAQVSALKHEEDAARPHPAAV